MDPLPSDGSPPVGPSVKLLSNIGLFAQPLHPLHVAFDGGGVGDLCGAAGRKPAPFSISHSLPVAPRWEENSAEHLSDQGVGGAVGKGEQRVEPYLPPAEGQSPAQPAGGSTHPDP